MASQISTFALVSIFAVVTVYGTAPITNEVKTSGLSIDNRSSTPDTYRLKNDVTPVKYVLAITVGKDFEADGFEGDLTITLKVNVDNTDKPITIHSDGLDVSNKFKLVKQSESEELLDQTQTPKPDLQTVTLKLEGGKTLLESDTYELKIKYKGSFQKDMRGFYINKYIDRAGKSEFAFATQLQPTHARKLFPCFDEPAIKSTFEVTLVYPKGYNALFNTPALPQIFNSPNEELVTQKFVETPMMSTYLLGIVISKFEKTESTGILGHLPHKVWSRFESGLGQSAYGLAQSQQLLKVMEQFTGKVFQGQGIEKVDHVALTDFSASAMENWGLVTYREALLLYNENESSKKDKQRSCSIIAHGLSHFWFGNLVTTEWWDNIWLNEGFARYFEYMAAHEVESRMEFDKQFVIEQHLAVLNADSLPFSQPLNLDPKSNTEVAGKFNSITSSKGASIIRMMSNWMEKKKFKNNLQKYIGTNEKKTVTPDELWTAMSDEQSQLPYQLADIMNSYVTQEGLPLLQVKLNQHEVTIEQVKRFGFNLKNEQDRKYYVPISYTANEKDNPKLDFEDTKPKCWIDDNKKSNCKHITLENDQSVIIVNIQASAYARVNYDDVLWDRIIATLHSKYFGGIDEITRAQIVDDALNLARAGVISYQRGLKIVEYLEEETSYYPWYTALNGFQYLLPRLPLKHTENLKKYILYLMESIHHNDKNVGDHIKALKLTLEKSWKCELGNEECIKEMNGLFKKMQGGETIDPDLRSTAYCVGIRENDDMDVWDTLFEQYKSTTLPSEARLIMTALGCTKSIALREKYLTMIVDENPDIRYQDADLVFSSVINGNADGVDVAAQFFIKNHEKLDKRFKNTNILTDMLRNMIDRFKSLKQIIKFEKFLNGLESTSSFKYDAIKLLDAADLTYYWIIENMDNINDSVMNYLDTKKPATTEPRSTPKPTSKPTPKPTPKSTPKPTTKPTSKPNGASVGSNVASILLVACNLYFVFGIRQ